MSEAVLGAKMELRQLSGLRAWRRAASLAAVFTRELAGVVAMAPYGAPQPRTHRRMMQKSQSMPPLAAAAGPRQAAS